MVFQLYNHTHQVQYIIKKRIDWNLPMLITMKISRQDILKLFMFDDLRPFQFEYIYKYKDFRQTFVYNTVL